MRISVPKQKGTLKDCYESLCAYIKSKTTQPLHKTSLMEHKRKFLGHYVSHLLEPSSDVYTFIVYDLYVYEGSKFTERTYIAVFGDGDSQYASDSENSLKVQSNMTLLAMPTGEAYRRYKKRKPVDGSLTKLK